MFDTIRRLLAPPQPAAEANTDWKAQGNGFLARGDLAEAARCYRRAVDADAQDAAACLNLGFVLTEQRQFGEARQWLEAVLRLRPQDHDAHFLLARVARSQDDWAAAAESYARAAACQPDFDLAWLEGGQA